LTCRTLGVDEETLTLLVKDLGNVNPERIRAIIEFALKVAKDPQGLVAADYDRVREQGVTDEEIVEIVTVAGFAVFSDIMADALKVEVEAPIAQALGR
jgi:alkylhydroperoxidase family enzyme